MNKTSRHPNLFPGEGEGGQTLSDQRPPSVWLGLAIGNSRLHWARFKVGELQLSNRAAPQTVGDHQLIETRHNPHIEPGQPLVWPWPDAPQLPLFIVSVVPAQTVLWQKHGTVLTQIPLGNAYAGLGADRACALWGALQVYGSPALVIDCGTALTFTGADAQQNLVGGAILPGLGLQFQSLGHKTALLPSLEASLEASLEPSLELTVGPPDRWATNTPDAIRSGIIWTLVAGINHFIEDWLQRFPNSQIVMTGGDADRLYAALSQQHPEPAGAVSVDPDLVFWGMRDLVWLHCRPEPIG